MKLKATSLFLSIVFLTSNIFSAVQASESPQMYDIYPPMSSNPQSDSDIETQVNQEGEEEGTEANHQGSHNDTNSSDKSGKPTKAPIPTMIPLDFAYPAEPPTHFAKNSCASECAVVPNRFGVPYVRKTSPNALYRYTDKSRQAPIPTILPMSFAYPAIPPANLQAHFCHSSENPIPSNLSAPCVPEEFMCLSSGKQDVVDPSEPICILPDFSSARTKKPEPIIPGAVIPNGGLSAKRKPYRDASFEVVAEPPNKIMASSRNITQQKLLQIIMVPEAQPFCRGGTPLPILIISVNPKLKEILSPEEFHEKATQELQRWAAIFPPEKNCFENIEGILTHEEAFEPFAEVFGWKGWECTCCEHLRLDSTFCNKHLDNRQLIISYKFDPSKLKDYDTSSVWKVMRYFVEFPEHLRIGNILFHPLFKDKDLIRNINEICKLYLSSCSKEEIIDFFISSGIVKKIKSYRYSDPTLRKIQDLFKSAVTLRDLNALMQAIGYFNLVRAIKVLPFI